MSKPTPKRSTEEKEAEFIDALEQILGAHLFPWQRKLVLHVRAQSLAGRKIDIMAVQAMVRKERG